MKILVSDPIADSAVQQMRDAGLTVDVKTGLPPEELETIIGSYDGLVVRSATKVRRNILEKATNLKVVVRGGVGVDNIDVEAAREKGVEVRNTPLASSISVAELALAMMFALARHISPADRSMKAGEWEKKAFSGTELFGKTLGLVGLGNIGREVARRAVAQGMRVVGFDVVAVSGLPEGVTQVDMDELLTSSDYISLHVPFIKSQGAVLGAPQFDKMKKGVRIVNCARGGVVDEAALAAAIKSGKVAAAALDVFEKEPPEMCELIQMPNVICTPHIGASTKEGQDRVGGEVASILIAWAKK